MEQAMTGVDLKIQEVAGRIRELREVHGFSVEEMARRTDLSVEEYMACEAGQRNLSIAFLYRCTLSFGVNPPVTHSAIGIRRRMSHDGYEFIRIPSGWKYSRP